MGRAISEVLPYAIGVAISPIPNTAVLLLGAARRQFAKRTKPGEAAEMPKWMGTVDDMKPGAALLLGVVCSAVNPKNLILAAGAAGGVAQVSDSVGDAVVALIVFVGI